MAPILVTEVLADIRGFTGPTRRMHIAECIPVPLAGSVMAGLRGVMHPEDSPALAASMEEGSKAGASMAEAEESTAEAATVGDIDSSHEVIQP